MKRIGMQAKNFQSVCLRCQPDDQDPLCRGCERCASNLHGEKTMLKMTKYVQVWWNAKLVDIITDEEARKILESGNATLIAENAIKITPKWF